MGMGGFDGAEAAIVAAPKASRLAASEGAAAGGAAAEGAAAGGAAFARTGALGCAGAVAPSDVPASIDMVTESMAACAAARSLASASLASRLGPPSRRGRFASGEIDMSEVIGGRPRLRTASLLAMQLQTPSS